MESGHGSGVTGSGPVEHRRQTVRIEPRSLTNHDARKKMWFLLSELADSLNPANRADLQMIEGSITLTTAKGTLDKTMQKASEAGAVWQDKPDDPFA